MLGDGDKKEIKKIQHDDLFKKEEYQEARTNLILYICSNVEWSGVEKERSVVVRFIFLESRNLQFLWDLIESVLANVEHLGHWFVVTV